MTLKGSWVVEGNIRSMHMVDVSWGYVNMQRVIRDGCCHGTCYYQYLLHQFRCVVFASVWWHVVGACLMERVGRVSSMH